VQAMAATFAPPSGDRSAGLRLLVWDGQVCQESLVTQAQQLEEARQRWPVLWIDVEGLDDIDVNRTIGRVFQISDLALEDAVTPDERPKVEVFGHQLLIAIRLPRFEEGLVVTDPVCLFLGDRYLITFRERATCDGFQPVRQRIQAGRTRVGKIGADALCSLLLDAVVDTYYPVVEQFSEQLERLEEEAIERPTPEVLMRIHDVRNDLMTLRRALWPTRDVLHALSREPTLFVGEIARTHFRDSYDHTMALLDLLESYREISSDLRDIYLASLNNRMNDVMKLLTVIATIFMPLTFITGWFGMNFDTSSPWNMPLLSYRYGGLVVIGAMVTVTTGMILWFWRAGWLKPWR
jgi:magnesium transporter